MYIKVCTKTYIWVCKYNNLQGIGYMGERLFRSAFSADTDTVVVYTLAPWSATARDSC